MLYISINEFTNMQTFEVHNVNSNASSIVSSYGGVVLHYTYMQVDAALHRALGINWFTRHKVSPSNVGKVFLFSSIDPIHEESKVCVRHRITFVFIYSGISFICVDIREF